MNEEQAQALIQQLRQVDETIVPYLGFEMLDDHDTGEKINVNETGLKLFTARLLEALLQFEKQSKGKLEFDLELGEWANGSDYSPIERLDIFKGEHTKPIVTANGKDDFFGCLVAIMILFAILSLIVIGFITVIQWL